MIFKMLYGNKRFNPFIFDLNKALKQPTYQARMEIDLPKKNKDIKITEVVKIFPLMFK